MKALTTLRKLINLIYILSFILFIAFFIGLLAVLFFDISSADIINNEKLLTFSKIELGIWGFMILLLYGGYLFTLYIFKNLVYNLKPKNLFTELQIAYLLRIGRLIIGLTLAEIAFKFLFELLYEQEINISFQTESLFQSTLFTLSIGFFFIFLSGLFKVARNLKQENQLTI
ncbi:DUF2975 domain-containing protein [Haloflavibacter putidus]|uniref:DUF2975 domain-containing protein n=1 Tax=Haloflavibacter putidus TaxID=2576776 RepID=A0A508A0L2_9FLAO|nr:DUF2975 domain-containing protein [Haloflavibacter putidus]TQD40485.1 DUF2975 domain-containing protein [Haloflavibacter putidus]